jgi:hypothetical protein
MHYWSIFLYIVGTDFYTLLLATDDVASLLAENLLKPSPTTSGVPRRLQPGLPVGSGSAPLATGLLFFELIGGRSYPHLSLHGSSRNTAAQLHE